MLCWYMYYRVDIFWSFQVKKIISISMCSNLDKAVHSAENGVGYLATFVVNSTSQSVELHYIHNKVATILPEEMSNF